MVCTGNICRSPIAQVLFESHLDNNKDVVVNSAGLAALVGQPAAPMSQELMQERGLDLSKHRAQQLTPELITQSDLILVMEAGQQKAVESMMPSARGRVYRIGKWGEFDVPDPYQGPREKYELALNLIEQGLRQWNEKIWGAEN